MIDSTTPPGSIEQLWQDPAASSAAGPDAFSALTSEEFVKIMFTELGNQDPLKPQDSAALVEQMANLRSIQSDLDMSKKLESLVTQNQLASAGGLIGKSVGGLDDENQRIKGVVQSVLKTADGTVLALEGGKRIAFSRVDEMFDAGAAAAQVE
jgi:flagellar basal-body rod modification protein FlgD